MIKYRQPLKSGEFHYWGYLNNDEIFTLPCGPFDASGPSEEYLNMKGNNGESDWWENDILKTQDNHKYKIVKIAGIIIIKSMTSKYYMMLSDMRFPETFIKIGNIHGW